MYKFLKDALNKIKPPNSKISDVFHSKDNKNTYNVDYFTKVDCFNPNSSTNHSKVESSKVEYSTLLLSTFE